MARQVELTGVSSKGQVVIPKSARKPGDYLAVELRGSSVLDDILREAEEDWRQGKAVTLWPKRERRGKETFPL